jgi:hypothetical protein
VHSLLQSRISASVASAAATPTPAPLHVQSPTHHGHGLSMPVSYTYLAPGLVSSGALAPSAGSGVGREFLSDAGVGELHNLKDQLREVQARMAMLTRKYEQISVAFRAETQTRKGLVSECTGLQQQLHAAHGEIRSLKSQVASLSAANEVAEEQRVVSC